MKLFALAKAIYFFRLPVLMLVPLIVNFSQPVKAEKLDPLKQSRQLVVVTTLNWEAVVGTMRQFERNSLDENWRATGSPVEIVVGRTGLAWGRGLHSANANGPQKVEGDGKSPAGIFALSSAFGFAPPEKMKVLKLPYLHITNAIECIDDAKSIHYNSIVTNTHGVDRDWTSSEKMWEYTEQYPLGVLVDHNVNPRLAGKGSCIFIHIWKGDGSGTAGCTAMEKRNMEKFIHWLDASKKPILVQLPEEEFRRVKNDWRLPELGSNSANK